LLHHNDNNLVVFINQKSDGEAVLMNRVRRSFSVEAKRCENSANFFSLRSEKNPFFRLFRFEAKHWKSQAKRKRMKRKKPSET
jgi:hypothetical protein